MIIFSGQKRSGKWTSQLLLLKQCWMRGERTAMLTSQYIRFENKPKEKNKND